MRERRLGTYLNDDDSAPGHSASRDRACVGVRQVTVCGSQNQSSMVQDSCTQRKDNGLEVVRYCPVLHRASSVLLLLLDR
jgi:hypothetical protein